MDADENAEVAGSYEQLKDVVYQLKLDEGFREKPSRDSLGNWFIGYGFDLSAGITKREATMILEERVRLLRIRLPFVIEGWKTLDFTRQDVLTNMAYNLGINGLLRFKNMLDAVSKQDFNRAADEMLDSIWSVQVGKRADQLADLMRSG